ncbi:hypothetical protein FB451DRAFT_1207954 [Mycena latifolia]|nr:hypothetical protein FB451DRAFT_1207954 [Mycena latifolia]
MHPTLKLQNLSQLGPSHERLARSAAAGSLEALRQVALISTDHPQARPDLLAPVFFANLDPLGIPTLSARNADGGELVLATDAVPDVWPRVWKWIQLLDRHREDLGNVNPFSATDSYAIYCAIILRLQDHKETRDVIYATSGVRDVITRGWNIFLDNKRSPDADVSNVCRFILEDTVSPINIDGIMMGAGGNITYLARLFVAHLNFVIPGPESPVSSETQLLLRGVIRLLDEINYRNELWNSALLSEGIVESLVHTMRCLAVSAVDGADTMLGDCFTILVRLLDVTRRHQYIVDALKAGLLHAIVLCRSFIIGVKFFLTVLLPRSTVYYSVLRQLDAELDTVQQLTETARFRASETLESWAKFMDFAATRLEIMKRYDNGDWLSGRNCDNLNCGKLMRTPDQQRCSRCGTFYYCSKECQTVDWKEGGHRKVCARLHSLLLNDPETVSTRDRSFLWALATYDYLTNKPSLYVKRVSITNKYPNQMLFSVLDYTAGAVETGVRLLQAIKPDPPSFRALWEDSVSRASRSRGRIHLVVLILPEGGNIRYRILPMHSATSAVQDGIDDIANSLPIGLDLENSPYLPVVAQKITALLKQDGCDAKLHY